MSSKSVGNANIYSALPKASNPLVATGVWAPTANVTANTFSSASGNDDAPFNQVLFDLSDNLVGTSTNPYMPVALSAYIPTLYKNIFDIQTNLQNVIPEIDVSDNRLYPTSFAVKKYVQDQIAGVQMLDLTELDALVEHAVNITRNTTILKGVPSTNISDTQNSTFEGGNITNYFDIDEISSSKNGSQKMILNTSELSDKYFMTIQLTGDKYFVVEGKLYQMYDFSILGDSLDMIQLLKGNNSYFFVNSYGGVFSRPVELNSEI